jgi:hypothetical protein
VMIGAASAPLGVAEEAYRNLPLSSLRWPWFLRESTHACSTYDITPPGGGNTQNPHSAAIEPNSALDVTFEHRGQETENNLLPVQTSLEAPPIPH